MGLQQVLCGLLAFLEAIVQRSSAFLLFCMVLQHQAQIDSKLLELSEMLGRGQGKLSEVLLQPVVDPSGDKCLAVLCALNKQEQTNSCSSLLYEHTFTPTDW